MRKSTILVGILSLTLMAAAPFPEVIDLPEGVAGEGVAVGAGTTFYAGSLADGSIVRGDLRAGTAEIWVDSPSVAPAVGLAADTSSGLLFVAGGPSGQGAAYDLSTGDVVAVFDLTAGPAFINDVIVTRDAAYFTNSFAPELYRVPLDGGEPGIPETIPLSGPAGDFVDGFNVNGIEAVPSGQTLILVNSTTGMLYAVDPDDGSSSVIDLGSDSVATGDGILLQGRTLYVLQNGTVPGVPNQVAVVRLAPDLSSGEVIETITNPNFETATTLALHGNRLVAVNAQFLGAPIDPEAEVVTFSR